MTNICGGCGGHKDQWKALCDGCFDDKQTITKTINYMKRVLVKLNKAMEEAKE